MDQVISFLSPVETEIRFNPLILIIESVELTQSIDTTDVEFNRFRYESDKADLRKELRWC